MKYLMISSMRNEAPYILEWLSYHRSIGVDGFLIYSNDCDDGTDAMLDRLDQLGLITHVRNDKITPAGVQWTALKRADKHPMKAEAEWVMFADVDEFVNIKAGEGRLDDLLAAVPDATAFALTWRMFGNNDIVEIDDALTISQFTRCAEFPCYVPITSSMFKTLFKNDGSYQKLGVHRPKNRLQKNDSKPNWVNGSGNSLGADFLDRTTVTYGANGGMDLACINHYSVRSVKAYLAKTRRGLPNRSDKQLDLGYWIDRNFNVEEEISIRRMVGPTHLLREQYLQDPLLNKLHSSGLKWHKDCAESLINTVEGVRLLTRILSVSRKRMSVRLASELAQKMSVAAKNEKAK